MEKAGGVQGSARFALGGNVSFEGALLESGPQESWILEVETCWNWSPKILSGTMNVRGATAGNTWSLYARDPLDSDREIGVGERIIQKFKKNN